MKKIKVFILAIVLFIISVVVIIANGKTYTIDFYDFKYANDLSEFDILISDENIAKCIDKSFENNVLRVKIESVSKGKTNIIVGHLSSNHSIMRGIHVHNFGVITINEYMGDSSGSIVIPISIAIWLIYVLYLLISSYRKSVKENMYLYKNIAYLGIIIFGMFAVISQLFAIFDYQGLIYTINEIVSTFSFAIVLFPIAFIVSIFVIISNIVLIRKEGLNLTNVLGLILGAGICFATILPDLLYKALYSSTWFDIHNQNGIHLYIYNFVEAVIKISITYIECVLLGTIIMGFKAAKRIPAFDKDYIIILGCQIKKDGSLTQILKGRVDKAIEFGRMQKEKTGKDVIFVPSGGKGDDEIIAEAHAMKNYLLEQGIKEESILIEDKSKNTFENIKFSSELIAKEKENAKIAFSTTNYHVFRAGNIASTQGLYFEGIGSSTKRYFWINAFIREFIATLFLEKKKHIAVICSIILFVAFMIAITYFNNNI